MADITRERLIAIQSEASCIGYEHFQQGKNFNVYECIADLILAELSPPAVATHAEPVAMPDGYVIVPIEPTEEMGLEGQYNNDKHTNETSYRDIYQAMVYAAPPVATQSQVGEVIDIAAEGCPPMHHIQVSINIDTLPLGTKLFANLTPALSHTEEGE